MPSEIRVSALFIHPLKSAAGMRVAEATIDALGFGGDRRWMAVDAGGGFLSQRQIPRMALIRATLSSQGDLCLSAPGVASIRVPQPGAAADNRLVTIWTDDVRALDGGDEAAAWLTIMLGCD